MISISDFLFLLQFSLLFCYFTYFASLLLGELLFDRYCYTIDPNLCKLCATIRAYEYLFSSVNFCSSFSCLDPLGDSCNKQCFNNEGYVTFTRQLCTIHS